MEIINALGRRKTSVARIYMKSGNGVFTINDRSLKEYFPSEILQTIINQPLAVLAETGKYDIQANIVGGGITGQAEALRLAISRALVEFNAESKPALKKEGFMTRDDRMVERKKFGKKKARKRFQFSKR